MRSCPLFAMVRAFTDHERSSFTLKYTHARTHAHVGTRTVNYTLQRNKRVGEKRRRTDKVDWNLSTPHQHFADINPLSAWATFTHTPEHTQAQPPPHVVEHTREHTRACVAPGFCSPKLLTTMLFSVRRSSTRGLDGGELQLARSTSPGS